MADARTTLVERAVERFNQGDYAAFLEIFAPGVVLLADPRVAEKSEYRGREGVGAWVEEAALRWNATRFAALAVDTLGETVLVELGVIGGTELGGGAWRLYVLLHWDGDVVSHLRAYPDRAEAVAASGMNGGS
jgi:hypothetical protein